MKTTSETLPASARRALRQVAQAGFSLIELMVSMAIGLLIVLAMVSLLVSVNRNNGELNRTNRVIENGRVALQLLQVDVAHGGFWGGFVPLFDDLTSSVVPTDVPTAVPDPCLAYASWTAAHKTNLVGIPVHGYEIAATVPSPTLSVCSSIVTNPKASTDVLVVRHADSCVPGTSNCVSDTSGELNFQASRNAADLSTYVLDTSGYTLKTRLGATNEKRRFVSNLYYVRNYSVTSGDGIPTLMRSEFKLSGGTLQHNAAEALIEGVEGFRVEYGIDSLSDTGAATNFAQEVRWTNPANLTSPYNRGDGIPDGAYVRCTTAVPCTAAQLMSVVAVKIYVLVRSETKSAGYTDTKTYTLGSPGVVGTPTLGPFNDPYKRHLFSTTVRLQNVSGRRETP